MSPLKALSVFVAGFGRLVVVGMSVSQTGFADAPARDGYGVGDETAASTHEGSAEVVKTGSVDR